MGADDVLGRVELVMHRAEEALACELYRKIFYNILCNLNIMMFIVWN